MTADDRPKVTSNEEQLIRGYVRSLTLPQLICLISESKHELGVREGTLPTDKRGILKASARERLSKSSVFDLDDLPQSPVQVKEGKIDSQEETPVDEQDPLGMGFA